jgi:transcriptional regulator with XRE-family HTH domain
VNSEGSDPQGREESGTPTHPGGEEGQPFRIGDYLARQRQLRGLSLEQLEEITRIPLRSLERLEAGAFDGENDGFARGFVRTVAQALGLDPEETTLLLLSEPAATKSEGARLSREFQWSLLALVVLFSVAGFWLSKGVEPTSTPMEQPKDVWVRHDAVRELANQVGVRSGPSSAPRVPIKPVPVQLLPQDNQPAPLAPSDILPDSPSALPPENPPQGRDQSGEG